MSVKLSPILNEQQFDANGNPLVGGKIYTYASGSSTPQTSYTDSTGATPQSNPIILNSRGEVSNPIWLTTGLNYKFVLYDADDVLVRTIDNVSGVNDASVDLSEWIDSGVTPTYTGATTFTVPGDKTSDFQVNRRVKCTVTAGTVYGYIVTSVYGALTTVTVLLDSGTLDAGLSAVQLGLVSATNTSAPKVTNAMIVDGACYGTKIGSKLEPIVASVNANALTVTLNPTTLDFRSTTLTTGTATTITISSAISMTVSSGSTLGTTNGTAARLVLLAINNAGTVELAIVNLAGGNQLDETNLINTTAEGGAGAADSANVIYSTTARTGVAYRVVGFIDITEATAGTWATAPTLVQGCGGQALAALSSIGYGQTWQDVKASRAKSTTYYNTTGKPIMVSVTATMAGANEELIMLVDSVEVGRQAASSATGEVNMQAIVPAGSSYIANQNGTATIQYWAELR